MLSEISVGTFHASQIMLRRLLKYFRFSDNLGTQFEVKLIEVFKKQTANFKFPNLKGSK